MDWEWGGSNVIGINTDYNYLIGRSTFLPDDYDLANRSDPDIHGCKKLYDDLLFLYFSEFVGAENKEQQFYGEKVDDIDTAWDNYYHLNNENPIEKSSTKKPPFYTIFYKKFLLSSDYIGPSVHWASQKGLSDNELSIYRTIGGHIVWPRGRNNTINYARGGKDSFYDRIDWTLFLVKLCYDSAFEKERVENELSRISFCSAVIDKCKKLVKSILQDKNWFDEFGSFKTFANHFLLMNSFVDSDFEIKWFAPPIPILPDNYRDFVENNTKAVISRNKIIKEKS